MNLPELNHSPDSAETENMGVERDVGLYFRERRVGLIENTAGVGENLYAGFPPSSQRHPRRRLLQHGIAFGRLPHGDDCHRCRLHAAAGACQCLGFGELPKCLMIRE